MFAAQWLVDWRRMIAPHMIAPHMIAPRMIVETFLTIARRSLALVTYPWVV
jgi:hypothetical protein